MVDIHKFLDSGAHQLGQEVHFKALLEKKAVINNGVAASAEDILGWDYVAKDDHNVCWSWYAAEAPRLGLNRPVQHRCPIGVRSIAGYEVDYRKAIDILMGMNCGDIFTKMTLFWPMTPDSKEPYWYFQMSNGNVVLIGAESGKGECFTEH